MTRPGTTQAGWVIPPDGITKQLLGWPGRVGDPARWDVPACRDDPAGSGGMSKSLVCPTDPLEHLRPDGISKAPVGHPRSFVF